MYLLDYKKNIRFDFDGELKIRYVCQIQTFD